MGKLVFLLATLCMLTGCATTEPQAFSTDPLVRPGAQIELGAITIPEEKSYEIDAAGLMREALEKSLAERGIAWQGEPDADRFVLDVLVEDYEPGNAFKRWVLPGYGSTIVHVSGRLTDLSTGEVAGEVDHEKAVHGGGAYTIGAWKKIFQTVADDIATELVNRIQNKGFVVRLRAWPSREIEIPVADKPQQFTIIDVTDARSERGRIGKRFAAFDVSMGDVFFYRAVPEFMEEAVTAELRGAGHEVTANGSGQPVSLDVVLFWAHTNTTALYWDVISNIEISATIGADMEDQTPKQATFSCETNKRTYVWPTLKLVTKVMDNCLIELMTSLRTDPIWQGS